MVVLAQREAQADVMPCSDELALTDFYTVKAKSAYTFGEINS